MIFYGLLVVEFALLYFVSSQLIRTITSFLQRFVHRRSVLIGIYATLFFPGTFIHEMSHLLMALILQIPTGEISLFPDLDELDESVRMGSVAIAEVDPFRRTLVGVAPILFGTVALISVMFVVFRPGINLVWWEMVLIFYFVFTVSNTMFSSKKDLEGVVPLFVALGLVVLVIGLIVYFIGVRVSFDFSGTFLSTNWINSLQRIEVFLAVPVLINSAAWLGIKILQRVFAKH